MNLENGSVPFIIASLAFFAIRITADEIASSKEGESKVLNEGVVIDLNVKFPFSNSNVIKDAITHSRLVNLTGNVVALADDQPLSSFNDTKGVARQTFSQHRGKCHVSNFVMIPWGISGSWKKKKVCIEVKSEPAAQYLQSVPIGNMIKKSKYKKNPNKAELESSKTLLMKYSQPALGQGYTMGGKTVLTWWERLLKGYWFTSCTLYHRIVPLLSSCSVVGVLSTDAKGKIIIRAHPQFGMLLFRKIDFTACALQFAMQAQSFRQLSKAAEYGSYLCMTVAAACLVAKIYSTIFPPPPPPPPPLSSDPIALQSMLRGESGSHGSEDEADRRSRITNALEKSLECPITMERMVDPVLW
jgi:hypothetical protein